MWPGVGDEREGARGQGGRDGMEKNELRGGDGMGTGKGRGEREREREREGGRQGGR